MTADPWEKLRAFTAARIALGRAGGSLPTAPLLDFRISHAQARDAVNEPFFPEALAERLLPLCPDAVQLESCAADRAEYLRRPDLGRRLSSASRGALEPHAFSPDLVIILSDGLSTFAVDRQSGPFLDEFLPLVRQAGWSLAPLVIVKHGRVAIQDEIGGILNARLSLMLLGERPGLGSPDSLGAYFTNSPAPGLTDAARNCVSNIRPEGLPFPEAARKIFTLLSRSLALGFSGVQLKDESALPGDSTMPALRNLAA